MSRYVNFNANSLPNINNESPSILSKVMMTAGKNLSSNTMIIIGVGILFVLIAIFYYFYYVSPQLKPKFQPNNEPGFGNSNNKTAELLLFYADWCPLCKSAKPIWNDLKSEYENKTINGYKLLFTEIDCSEETAEVEKLMNQYNIEGYPTIKLIKDGQVIEYDAKPTRETLLKFLNTVL
jgi:thiol-disulfide isomerase/thioredoxin